MALSDNYAPTKTLGNGVTTIYSFSWDGINVDFVKVFSQNVSTGVITEITTGITKALNSGSVGGTVTFLTAPTSDVYIIIARETPKAQTDPYTTSGGFPAATIENNFNKVVAMSQETVENLSRSIAYPLGTDVAALGISVEIPIPSSLKALRWNALATALENYTPTTTDTNYPGSIGFGLDASKAASPSAGDIYFAIDTNRFYKCISGGTWTTAMNFSNEINLAKGTNIASATTCDIGAATGNFVHITGTTTITGLGTIQAGTHRWVVFDGILTLTHNATSLILPGGASITTAAGDCALFISEGSGNWRCPFYQKASGVAVVAFTPTAANALAGSVVQVLNTQSGAVQTGTALIPDDDTIPQNTEGDEYLTLAITPKSATNKLKITVNINYSISQANQFCVALFQDSTANALASSDHYAGVNEMANISLIYYMTAGTTSPTTFKIRAGQDAAGTTYINGYSAITGRVHGGVQMSSMTIEEIKV